MSELHTEVNRTVIAAIKESEIKHKSEALALYTILVTKRDYNTNLTSNVSYGYIHEIFGWGKEKTSSVIKEMAEIKIIEYFPGDSKDGGRANMYAFPLETFKSGAKSTLPEQLKKKAGEKIKKMSRSKLTQEELINVVKQKGNIND